MKPLISSKGSRRQRSHLVPDLYNGRKCPWGRSTLGDGGLGDSVLGEDHLPSPKEWVHGENERNGTVCGRVVWLVKTRMEAGRPTVSGTGWTCLEETKEGGREDPQVEDPSSHPYFQTCHPVIGTMKSCVKIFISNFALWESKVPRDNEVSNH